jgi:hypothetical protein
MSQTFRDIGASRSVPSEGRGKGAAVIDFMKLLSC